MHYYLNLTDANLKQEATWKLEYVMTKQYNIKDLTPESLYRLAKQFQKPKSIEFQNYYRNYIVNFDASEGCDEACKQRQLCAIMHVDASSYFPCITQMSEFNLEDILNSLMLA